MLVSLSGGELADERDRRRHLIVGQILDQVP